MFLIYGKTHWHEYTRAQVRRDQLTADIQVADFYNFIVLEINAYIDTCFEPVVYIIDVIYSAYVEVMLLNFHHQIIDQIAKIYILIFSASNVLIYIHYLDDDTSPLFRFLQGLDVVNHVPAFVIRQD